MDLLNNAAAVASILGLIATVLTFFQARRASEAAAAARDAVTVRALADELELSCVRAEQLLDFLNGERFSEAVLRIGELVSSLSEMPRRRDQYLDERDRNTLLNCREQLQSIGEIIHQRHAMSPDPATRARMTRISGQVVMALREILGSVKSGL